MSSISAVSSVESRLVDEVTVLARACAEVESFVALLAHEVRTRLKVTERALAQGDVADLRLAGENTRAPCCGWRLACSSALMDAPS